jgi:hypothetical protein
MSDPYTRYFNAYLAWKAAKNPKFKEYWEGVMAHFMKEFKNEGHSR